MSDMFAIRPIARNGSVRPVSRWNDCTSGFSLLSPVNQARNARSERDRLTSESYDMLKKRV